MKLKAKKAQLFFNYIFLFAVKFNGILNNLTGIKSKGGNSNGGISVFAVLYKKEIHIIQLSFIAFNENSLNILINSQFNYITLGVHKNLEDANIGSVLKLVNKIGSVCNAGFGIC